MKIAVLGTGMVGKTIAGKLDALGHEVSIGTRDPAETRARTQPGQYGDPPMSSWLGEHPKVGLATYADAVTLATVFHRARPDLKNFRTEPRRALEQVFAAVDAIVARGPQAFGASDVGTLLDAALKTLDVLDEEIACTSSNAPRRGPHFVAGTRTREAGRPIAGPRLPARGTR